MQKLSRFIMRCQVYTCFGGSETSGVALDQDWCFAKNLTFADIQTEDHASVIDGVRGCQDACVGGRRLV